LLAGLTVSRSRWIALFSNALNTAWSQFTVAESGGLAILPHTAGTVDQRPYCAYSFPVQTRYPAALT
jgi:hypothetical protein